MCADTNNTHVYMYNILMCADTNNTHMFILYVQYINVC